MILPFQRIFGSPLLCRRTFGTFSKCLGIVPFKLADIGEGISEVEILQWFVKPGDKVGEFDKICEVQSDKATVEITSRYEGKIKALHYKVSDMAIVGKPLVDIEVDDEETGQALKSKEDVPESCLSRASNTIVVEEIDQVSSKVLAAPAVRKMAKEMNLDLFQVVPSGKGGRVLKEDLLLFQEQQKTSPLPKQTPSLSELVQTHLPPVSSAAAVCNSDRVLPVRGLQRIMVKSMTAANTIPHFGFYDEVDMNKCIEFRKSVLPFAEKKGIKLTFMPIFIKAVSLALMEYPQVNCHVNADCSEITVRGAHNVGLAMDTPNGLIVPNIKNVQTKTILEIAADLNRLQHLGAAGKLGKEDITGGTITLSNIGAIGGTYASPILFAPEAAICAIGKIQKLPRFDAHGAVKAMSVMNISWSADHRALDGATMARFSTQWKQYLENPENLLLSLR